MSRLFGVMCNEPDRLGCALYAGKEALVARTAGDGWGLAFFHGGEPLLRRHPKPHTDELDFYGVLEDLRSDYVIGHVRDAGMPNKLENTQPFRFRSWVFAMTGQLDKFTEIEPALLEHVPDFLKRNIKGRSHAERLFYLFLSFLHDSGKLDDVNVAVADVAASLRATLSFVDRLAQDADGGPARVNLATANGRVLLALRRGPPMWLWKVDGIRECPVCQRMAGGTADRRRLVHEHLKCVLVCSEPQAVGPGAEEVPDDTIVGVARDLSTSLLPLG